MKVRLFAGLKVPDALRRQAQALPRTGLDSPHWSHPDDLHITLRFIGEIEEERIEEIAGSIAGAAKMKSFPVMVRGLALFGKKRQSILYMPIESVKKITHLSAEITERLTKIGFVFPEQFFTPHVTLARLKNPRGLEEYIARNEKEIAAQWPVDRFFLFRSADPDSEGKRYSVLREYALAAH